MLHFSGVECDCKPSKTPDVMIRFAVRRSSLSMMKDNFLQVF